MIGTLDLRSHVSGELDRLHVVQTPGKSPLELELSAPVVSGATQHENYACPKTFWQPHLLIVETGRIALGRTSGSGQPRPKLQVQHHVYEKGTIDKRKAGPIDSMLLFNEAIPELILTRSSETGLWELHEDIRQVVEPDAAGPLRAFVLLVALAGQSKIKDTYLLSA